MTRMLIGLTVLTLCGCNPYTYINVPAQDGDLARHNPNSAAVRELCSVALNAILDEQPVDGDVKIMLPEGSSILSYEIVLPTVSDRALAHDHDAQQLPAETLAVRAVRARGTKAQVDIARSDRTGLSTVYLHYSPVSSWRADRIHHWGLIEDLSVEGQATAAP